jgi:hypothetical protein
MRVIVGCRSSRRFAEAVIAFCVIPIDGTQYYDLRAQDYFDRAADVAVADDADPAVTSSDISASIESMAEDADRLSQNTALVVEELAAMQHQQWLVSRYGARTMTERAMPKPRNVQRPQWMLDETLQDPSDQPYADLGVHPLAQSHIDLSLHPRVPLSLAATKRRNSASHHFATVVPSSTQHVASAATLAPAPGPAPMSQPTAAPSVWDTAAAKSEMSLWESFRTSEYFTVVVCIVFVCVLLPCAILILARYSELVFLDWATGD